jgi:hypothetical protein
MTGTDLTVELVTASAQLPASLASSMPAVSYIDAAGTSQFTGGSVSLSGQSPELEMAAGATTEIPSITAAGTVVPQSAGTAYAEAPQSLQLAPVDGSTKLAPITCTATSAVQVQVTVTSATSAGPGSAGPGSAGTGSAGTGSGATGLPGAVVADAQVYRCTGTSATATMQAVDIVMRLGHSGPDVVGSPDDVSLSSPSDAFGGALPGTATPMAATASLGLAGAYAGSIPLADSGSAGQVMLSARWMPQTSGTFQLRAPSRFSVRLRTVQATTVSVICTAITTTTTTAVVRVTTAKESIVSVAATQPAATQPAAVMASGAPDTGTGSSLHATTNMTLAVGGSAIVIAGIVVIALALRRRRGQAAI